MKKILVAIILFLIVFIVGGFGLALLSNQKYSGMLCSGKCCVPTCPCEASNNEIICEECYKNSKIYDSGILMVTKHCPYQQIVLCKESEVKTVREEPKPCEYKFSTILNN